MQAEWTMHKNDISAIYYLMLPSAHRCRRCFMAMGIEPFLDHVAAVVTSWELRKYAILHSRDAESLTPLFRGSSGRAEG
jgi:hypothetical protein